VEVLQGQEALIITMGIMASSDQQTRLIEAAAAAKVAWILPNEYGSDNANQTLSKMDQSTQAKLNTVNKSKSSVLAHGLASAVTSDTITVSPKVPFPSISRIARQPSGTMATLAPTHPP
jgi:hypothetical protein